MINVSFYVLKNHLSHFICNQKRNWRFVFYDAIRSITWTKMNVQYKVLTWPKSTNALRFWWVKNKYNTHFTQFFRSLAMYGVDVCVCSFYSSFFFQFAAMFIHLQYPYWFSQISNEMEYSITDRHMLQVEFHVSYNNYCTDEI